MPGRARIHVSVFVTSPKKRILASPGGHVPQALVPVFKTGFFSANPKHKNLFGFGFFSVFGLAFFLPNPNGVARQAPCFEIGATFVFLNRLQLFFVSSYSPQADFIVDVRSTVKHSFTPARNLKGQLTRCWPSLPLYSCYPMFPSVIY